MIYTVIVTVEVSADSEHEAYGYIRHALDQAKKQEVVYLDAEVLEQRLEHDDLEPPTKLTRQERLQGLADSGCDTWEEYRGER